MTTATAKRRIRSGHITHISLCRRGANQMPVLMKSGNRLQIELLTKLQPEGLMHSLVYVPDVVDGQGDIAQSAVIKQIAHDFLANGGNIDIEHDLQPLGTDRVRIAETFIVQKGDPRFADWKDYSGRPVNAEGSWGLILKILDPELRKQAEAGMLNGVSMFGTAEVEHLSKTSNTNTNEMTPEEMQTLTEMLVKGLSAAKAPAPAAPVAPAVPEIQFEGDPLDPEDIAKHMDRIMLAKVNWNDPRSIASYQGHLSKRQAEIQKKAAEAAKQTGTQPTELEKAQAALKAANDRVAELQKASGAPVNGDPAAAAGANDKDKANLSKGESDQWKAGRDAMRKFQGRDKK